MHTPADNGRNGAMTLGMALAPVVGSYVNLLFGWRGNFTVLLLMTLLCLALGHINLPAGIRNTEILVFH